VAPLASSNPEFDLFSGTVYTPSASPAEVDDFVPARDRPNEEDIVWEPLENTSQYTAMTCPSVNEMLLAGGRGWGKTDVQIMRFRRNVGKGYGTYWRGVIFDREYKNLDDLIVKTRRLFGDGDGGHATFLSSNSALKWVWDTGEELLFRVAKDEVDYWAYHGHEYPFIGWNELTKYPTGKLYRKMRSVNRTGFDPIKHTPRITTASEAEFYGGKIGDYKTPDLKPLPPIPLEIVSTTNPYGAGHNWVKTEFIDVAPYGKIVYREHEIHNPKTRRDEIIRRSQVTIFGTYRENKYLSPEYIAGLVEETDENILKAWVDGDWDIVAGGAFDDVFRKNIHILPRFPIPKEWLLDRTLDWGSSHPCSVGWWAETNGEEVTFIDVDGSPRVFCPPKGTLIQIAELYFTKKIGTNEGTKRSATEVAEAIKNKEIELLSEGWIVKQPSPGPADNQISNVTEADTETIAVKMANKGVRWEKSDKSAGSRKIGLELLRDRMSAAKQKREEPHIYFMVNCRASISTIPVLPRDEKDPEDVDTSAEDHPYDMARYRALKSSNRAATRIPFNFPS
jgi:hypothetical protein